MHMLRMSDASIPAHRLRRIEGRSLHLTYVNAINILGEEHANECRRMKLEQRTARLTILIDPRKKAVFERLCASEDQTPSQVVRSLIREYIEQRLGRPWKPGETVEETLKALR